ncbi:hypothetical protein AURDEDRAFT_128587 [Auricularia subglabra TFB-10046 SS5]|nr:hypothetical protein AURDEDRAFT_128587 [Auricularia subglabra TFB-10046 SS5]
MSAYLQYTCPQGMSDALFKRCADWASRMDHAVHNEQPVPMEQPPLLYNTFRRVNPECIDPVFAVGLQRNAGLVREARHGPGPTPPSQGLTSMVPLDAVQLMFSTTRSMLNSAQRDARWQVKNTLRALSRSAAPSAPFRGYQQRARNRQYRGPANAPPPPPRRPRNSIRADRGGEHVHVHVPHHLPGCPRARFAQDDPPSYRRARRPFQPTSPVHGSQPSTPHPHGGFLFRGPADEDQVMREATPADVPDPLSVTPRPIINAIDLRTPEPVIIDDSERGTQGTTTPRRDNWCGSSNRGPQSEDIE